MSYLLNIIAASRRRGGLSYSAEVLADNPLAYWRLGEASGTNAADASGNGNNGTYVGSPTLGVAGAVAGDTAVLLNGTTQYATYDSLAMSAIPGITIEAWVKLTDGGNNEIIQANISGPSSGYSLTVVSGQIRVSGRSQSSDAFKTYLAGALVNDGEWHHVAGVMDFTADRMRIYVDAVEHISGAIGFGSSTYTQGTTSASPRIGSHSSVASREYDGTLDEVAIYSTALSAARILAHYNAAT